MSGPVHGWIRGAAFGHMALSRKEMLRTRRSAFSLRGLTGVSGEEW